MEEKYFITKIEAEEIKDSRNNPTIKVKVCAGSYCADFSVPSGASTGTYEAHEFRDEDGRGVQKVINKINSIIAESLIGQDILNQKEIDSLLINLDGTLNKENLGGNAMIGVSIACAKVGAMISGQELYEYLRTLSEIKPSRRLPYLYMNLINGGKHAKNDLAFQEYHIVPITENIQESIDIGFKIQDTMTASILKDLGEGSIVLGDEGGLAPKLDEIKKPLLYLKEAIKENNLEGKVHLALDVAASSFFRDGLYFISGKSISKEELTDVYLSLIQEFNLFSIEDPFQEEDFESFRTLREKNTKVIIVGDDLTVTNKVLLQKAIDNSSIDALIIKPNQIGTLSETLETMKLARENNKELIVSHRSGETMDDFIADLAFAFGCFGLKAGSPKKAERMVKYKRLVDITKNY